MKYLVLLLAIALANSELIITETQVKPPLSPVQPAILPRVADSEESVPIGSAVTATTENSAEVVIGKVIPARKEQFAQTTQGFTNERPEKNGKHGKERSEHRSRNQLRGFDQSTPNYYPYASSAEYRHDDEYEIEDEDAIAVVVFMFIGIIVFVAVVAACKRRKAMKRARRMERERAANAQGGNVIENINAQIRYHQQESNRLRNALLEQQQEQQNYQQRVQEQQRQQYQQYQHLPPPVIVPRQLNETQQPIRREYPEQPSYSQSFNYPHPNQQNYARPPPQAPYRPFRNEEQLSVIHNHNPVPSETFSDYPRL